MVLQQNKKRILNPDIWIISKGKYSDLDVKGFEQSKEQGVRPILYEISDLAKYMLSPFQVEVMKKLVGYEIHYHGSAPPEGRTKLQTLLRRVTGKKDIPPEQVILDCGPKTSQLKDKWFESYVGQVHERLTREGPKFERLSQLEFSGLSDLKGLCEGIKGNNTPLGLRGSMEERVEYLRTNLCHDVGVVLEKPQMSPGLFEMRGYDFKSFSSERRHHLIKLVHEEKLQCCVLRPDNQVEYWIDDVKLLDFMQLLQHSIETNPHFHEAFDLCAHGQAQPAQLLFHDQLKIDYSASHCPEPYREVLENAAMSPNEKELVINSLNNLQLGISFNYIPQPSASDEKLTTTLSVMHDLRALEPIKDDFPHLYSQISHKATSYGIGRFYLLDSIRGCPNEF